MAAAVSVVGYPAWVPAGRIVVAGNAGIGGAVALVEDDLVVVDRKGAGGDSGRTHRGAGAGAVGELADRDLEGVVRAGGHRFSQRQLRGQGLTATAVRHLSAPTSGDADACDATDCGYGEIVAAARIGVRNRDVVCRCRTDADSLCGRNRRNCRGGYARSHRSEDQTANQRNDGAHRPGPPQQRRHLPCSSRLSGPRMCRQPNRYADVLPE